MFILRLSLTSLDKYIDIFILQGSYPARLCKVLIVTAPLWFKAPFKFLRLFVKEKLRDRVRFILCHYIILISIPNRNPDMGKTTKS